MKIKNDVNRRFFHVFLFIQIQIKEVGFETLSLVFAFARCCIVIGCGGLLLSFVKSRSDFRTHSRAPRKTLTVPAFCVHSEKKSNKSSKSKKSETEDLLSGLTTEQRAELETFHDWVQDQRGSPFVGKDMKTCLKFYRGSKYRVEKGLV